MTPKPIILPASYVNALVSPRAATFDHAVIAVLFARKVSATTSSASDKVRNVVAARILVSAARRARNCASVRATCLAIVCPPAASSATRLMRLFGLQGHGRLQQRQATKEFRYRPRDQSEPRSAHQRQVQRRQISPPEVNVDSDLAEKTCRMPAVAVSTP